MKRSEAEAMVGIVAAIWPTPSIPAETVDAWATMLAEKHVSVTDVGQALRLLGQTNRFRPSIAEIIGVAEEEWRDRLASESGFKLQPKATRGISFAEYLRDNPEMAERVRALDDRSGSLGPAIRKAVGVLLGAEV